MKLSILIKTYNEEGKIGKCIDAVQAAIRGIDGGVEIIVADSLSTDATIGIARRRGVQIVQLCNVADRGCGSGVQLGFQYATGRYFYLLDGDMELQHDFLIQALALLEQDNSLAGVSGMIQDREARNWFDRERIKNKPLNACVEAEWLSGGGLYRRDAIKDAGGYAGNRNLKAFEEAELGLRLRSRGWRLVRLPLIAVYHTGHAESTSSLIMRHWRTGRMNSGGVLLKSSFGKPWFPRTMRMFIHPLCVLVYWSMWLAALVFTKDIKIYFVLSVIGVLAWLALLFKKRSIVDASFSVLLWHVMALGIVRGGILQSLQSPIAEIPSVILSCAEQQLEESLSKCRLQNSSMLENIKRSGGTSNTPA